MDWTEYSPVATTVNSDGLGRALELVEARGAVAQLCVLLDGRPLLDRAFGCTPEALFWKFSAGKPLVAMLTHLLAERGSLTLDDPVASYWPEFGASGKAEITVRQVLQHRSGFAVAGRTSGDLLAMTNWQRSLRRIERAHPRWPVGEVPAYQFLSYGFILGELIQRITGRPVADVLSTELLQSLEMDNTYLGLPDEQWSRHVPVRGRGIGLGLQPVLNRRATRRAIIPAAGISTTARDLAVFYLMLLRGGQADGVRVIAPETIAEARTPSADGELDRFAGVPIRWSQGFQLGGARPDPTMATPLGRLSSRLTFGHNGSNCCIGWADPTRGLVFVYFTNLLAGREADVAHLAAVADAVIDACPPAR